MPRVVLAMSGGVDSSVAAHLLLEQGFDVVGVFMRHGESSPAVCNTTDVSRALPVVSRLDHKQGCCTASDAEDARRVADRLAIPFYALDLQHEFGRIMDYFADEYLAGRTPNPCVQCNNWIKFGKLFDYADSVDAEWVATGHYARLVDKSGGRHLLRGVDTDKDQSYVLFGIERQRLNRMLLPVGDFQKSRIRELAALVGLNVADKKDSQEICFVTSGRYDEFVKSRRGQRDTAGDMVTTTGDVVAQHAGIESFTVGQRKKLGVALGDRKFVVSVDPDTNRVVIGDRHELDRTELTASNTNWLADVPQDTPTECLAQIRYNAAPEPATLTRLADNRLAICFATPQFGVCPGQAVVCYDGPRVLGGGWIDS